MTRTISLPRDDLERLCASATAFTALQRVAQQQAIAIPDVHATIDGRAVTITAAAQQADLDALEQAVIRTRRLLGWRS